MYRVIRPFFVALAVLFGAQSPGAVAQAGLITVGAAPDQNALADWGITVKDATSNGAPGSPGASIYGFTVTGANQASYNGFQFRYMKEDQRDLPQENGDVLGPFRGGQNYDAEFLGVGVDDGKLVIAILTGQRPDNGFDYYAPGDIRITTTNGTVYGIEVGGGAGHSNTTDKTPIWGGASGSTFDLDSRGFTDQHISHTYTTRKEFAGSIWYNPDWILDPIEGDYRTQIDHGDTSTSRFVNQLGSNFYNSRDDYKNQHAIIEVAIPLAWLSGVIDSVEWAPACGNDLLEVDSLQIIATPEPMSGVMMVLGGLGAIAYRRKLLRPANHA